MHMYSSSGIDRNKLWTHYYSMASAGASNATLYNIKSDMNRLDMKNRMLSCFDSIDSKSSSVNDLPGYQTHHHPYGSERSEIFIKAKNSLRQLRAISKDKNSLSGKCMSNNESGGTGFINSIKSVFFCCGKNNSNDHS